MFFLFLYLFFLLSFFLPLPAFLLNFYYTFMMLFCGLARVFQCTLVGDLRFRRTEFEMFKWDAVPVM